MNKATSLGASVAAIRSHYDVGDDFYRLWLDPTMTYSCALWDDTSKDDTLELAQHRKLDYLVSNVGAQGCARVLDIGCGWGSLLHALVTDYTVGHAVGLTLSAAQAEAVAARELPQVEVRIEDWRDHEPELPYDAIITIGAFEHFARLGLAAEERLAEYASFFDRCAKWLTPDGKLAVQTISDENVGDERADGPVSEFMLTSVFPESTPPTVAEILRAAEAHFEVQSLVSHGEHYARTCREWRARLRRHEEEAKSLIGPDVVRHYDRYLTVAHALFRLRRCSLIRAVFRKRPVR